MYKYVLAALLVGAGGLLSSSPAWALKSMYRAESKLSPDELWAKVGDFCGVTKWVPPIRTCVMSPDKKVRTITVTGGGGDVVERQVERSETKRLYTFIILKPGPFPLGKYRATMHVVPAPGGSAFIWSSTYTAKGKSDAEVKAMIDALYKSASENLVSQ
jgi:hypothetical protein